MIEGPRRASENPAGGLPSPEPPCVVQYLYVHAPGEAFRYPSSHSAGNAARLASRYLECALVQAASLRWRAPDCDLLLVSNLARRDSLTVRGRALLERILELGVELVPADYRHPPRRPGKLFQSSYYVLDAIDAVAARVAADRQLWLVDVDCIWSDPQRAFAARASGNGVGALMIGYPPDWTATGRTRTELGGIGARLGACASVPDWIGGEVLTASAGELRRLVQVCEQLDSELAGIDVALATEEQLMTLAGGLGRIEFDDLAPVAGRIWTGRRHQAVNPADPSALALWHLPGEKGLSIRRAANALLRGRPARLRRDLADPRRAAVRFNLSGVRWWRSVRDDIWIAAGLARDTLATRLWNRPPAPEAAGAGGRPVAAAGAADAD